ncbi:MAG: hypothetical protein F6K47_35885 [Symploca sp. SIO2E6]|nr:hypothetical protein [Symploca sp. SIO2E6]
MARIQQQFGTNLALTTLFTESTIEAQASLLSAATNTPISSPLVPIKPTGSLPPFFCIHPGGGHVLGYAALARQLDFDQELPVSVDELRPLGLEEKLNYVLTKILQLLPLEIKLEQMCQMFAVFQANIQAENSYVPQPYSGQIAFFCAEDPPEQLAKKQKLIQVWSSLAAGGINIHTIPGNHFSIIPSEALAKELSSYLRL